MNYTYSSTTRQYRCRSAPGPSIGGLLKSAAPSVKPRPDATGARTTTSVSTRALFPSTPWRSARQQRLSPALAVTRDTPKDAGSSSSAGSRRSFNSGAAPNTSAPNPRSPRPQSQKPKSKTPRRQTKTATAKSTRLPLAPAPPPPPPPLDSSSSRPPVDVGQQLELTCARLALEGKGVCLLPPTGFVVLVERALPGEVVVAEVVSVKRGYAEARKLASLSPHRDAVPTLCPYFGPCGGCTLQSLRYDAQLAEKRNQVEQTLRRVGRLGPFLDRLAAKAEAEPSAVRNGRSDGGGVAPTVGCQEVFAYRNKMMFHFSAKRWLPPDVVEEDRPCLGLLRPGTADVVLPVVQHGCKLQAWEANALLARVEELVSEQGLLPYNHSSGKGVLKHLVIRSGSGALPAAAGSARGREREFMVGFGVTHGSAVKQLRLVAESLGREFQSLSSVVAQVVAPPQPPPPTRGGGGSSAAAAAQSRGNWRGWSSRQDRTGPSAPGGDDALEGDDDADTGSRSSTVTSLYGTPYIHDVLGGLTFRISPGSFFQTNSRQTEVLYDIVRQAAALRPNAVDTVLDLYCGTGAIGLSLAAHCRRVVGIEVLESAVEDARANAALNGITNVDFLCADVDTIQRSRTVAAAAGAVSGSATIPYQQLAEPAAAAAAVEPMFLPDVVVVDPARGGLSLDAAAFLSRCSARRVVYVSCNMATQARDLDRLCNGPGAPFQLVSVQTVDMFPHTDHVETVAVLDRREAAVVPAVPAAAV